MSAGHGSAGSAGFWLSGRPAPQLIVLMPILALRLYFGVDLARVALLELLADSAGRLYCCSADQATFGVVQEVHRDMNDVLSCATTLLGWLIGHLDTFAAEIPTEHHGSTHRA